MPPAIAYIANVILYIAAAVGAGAVVTAAVATWIATAIVNGLIMFAAQKLLGRKTPTIGMDALMADVTGRAQMIRQAAAPRRLIFGRARVSGPLAFAHETGSSREYLHLVILIATHLCEDFEQIYVNDTLCTIDGSGNVTSPAQYVGYVRVIKHMGSTTQTADAVLTSETAGLWDSTCRLQGICYAYVRIKFSLEVFPGGMPNMSFVMKGAMLLDPRDGSTASYPLSSNPAMVMYNYMQSVKYGLNTPDSEFNMTRLHAAINACWEDVPIAAGGTEKRYTLNGTIGTDQRPGDMLEAMLTAMSGKMTQAGGEWFIDAGVYLTPTITLDENDLRGPVQVTTKLSRRERCNGVKGTYVSEGDKWQPVDFPPAINSLYLSEDGGERMWKDVQFPFTLSPSTCQRMAKIDLERSRQEMTVKLSCKLTALKTQAGNNIMLNLTRFGFVSKVFEVTNFQLVPYSDSKGVPNIGVDLILRETASACYDWNDGLETLTDPAPNTTLPDPTAVAAPSGLTAVSNGTTTLVQEDGTVVPRIKLNWTAPADQYVLQGGRIRVEYKLSSTSEWLQWTTPRGTTTQEFITDVTAGANHDVRIRAENVFGCSSTWVTISNTAVQGDLVAPATPTGLTAVAGTGCAILDWADNTEDDFDQYAVFRHTSNVFGSATEVWRGRASQYTDFKVSPGVTYYYWLKALDSTFNASAQTASANVVPNAGLAGNGLFTIICRGNCVDLGGGVVKKVGGSSLWDSDAYSLEGYTNGAFVSFQANDPVGDYGMVALNTDPGTDQSYPSLDYAWHIGTVSIAYVYQSSVLTAGPFAFTASTVFSITYDGANVRYLMDGVVMHTTAVAAGLKLFFDSSFAYPNTQINALRFGPMGAAGAAGAPGIDGTDGADGADGVTTPIATGAQVGSANFTSAYTYEDAITVSATPGARVIIITGYVKIYNAGDVGDFEVVIGMDFGTVLASIWTPTLNTGDSWEGPISVTVPVSAGTHSFGIGVRFYASVATNDWTLSEGAIAVI